MVQGKGGKVIGRGETSSCRPNRDGDICAGEKGVEAGGY